MLAHSHEHAVLRLLATCTSGFMAQEFFIYRSNFLPATYGQSFLYSLMCFFHTIVHYFVPPNMKPMVAALKFAVKQILGAVHTLRHYAWGGRVLMSKYDHL